MPKFERHIFVCVNEREPGHVRGCCSAKGSALIRERFKQALEARGLKGRVRANQSLCLDQCEHGPTVVVYPEQVWYGFVKPEDVEEIVESHIIGGQPVERLRLPDGCINTTRCPHKGGGGVTLGGLK
ncbi:MAG TPA: (2Fe-2S) ferredoxin domain-containing protein [Phycisphaerae bacterium]|jgi:(2Fe-2S) ferredoxin